MRAFVAIPVPEEIFALYTPFLKRLKSFAYINAVSTAKAHLTLAFFEDLPENKVPDVIEAINKIKLENCLIKVKSLGTFGRRGLPSVIMLEIDSPELVKATNALRLDLSKKNISFDEKPFRAHLTLARVKQVTNPGRFDTVFNYCKEDFKPSGFYASSLCLLSSNMVSYEELYTKELVVPEQVDASDTNNKDSK